MASAQRQGFSRMTAPAPEASASRTKGSCQRLDKARLEAEYCREYRFGSFQTVSSLGPPASMRTYTGRSFTLEVRRKRVSRPRASSDREPPGFHDADAGCGATIQDRNSGSDRTSLQNLFHQYSGTTAADPSCKSGHSLLPEEDDGAPSSTLGSAGGTGRILPDLTAPEPAEVLIESRPPRKRKSRSARVSPASPNEIKPKPRKAVERPSRIAAAPVHNSFRPAAERAAPAMFTRQPEKRGTSWISRDSYQRPSARDRSGKSFRAGQRWKRRLPKVCW
jgi:hypothetical protein